MSGTKVTLAQNTQALLNLEKGLKWLKSTQVMVGIPAEQNAAHKGGLSNAQLLYIHQNGAPGAGIPARPVLEPGVQEKQGDIQSLLLQGVTKALSGDLGGAQAAYEKAGASGAAGVKEKFGAGLTPLKPETVKRKGTDVPLIDTGALKNAITYVVRQNTGEKEAAT